MIPNYIIQDALIKDGSQQSLLNQRYDFFKATGMSMSILDWNLTLADGLAKIMGAEVKVFTLLP
ncbi:hypothetical protein [Dyadobacter sp. LHD-138]|uniref:hypothetical protein n=1 Tax=Dyadobacter sp. LHD-138 TaxID=3071413 RepID=UPI0027E1DDA9|nr:hypothetical protein [Dyadobacter sp. LHD-138]MDQ6480583.1 hypothetical protein [Dyadobacter sp. LHD-138]